MTNPNDPAFPANSGLSGLTKREWFAGMILPGFISGRQFLGPAAEDFKAAAKIAVALADALIAELNKSEEKKNV